MAKFEGPVHSVGMGIVSWGALAQRRAQRSRDTSVMANVILAIMCGLLALAWIFVPSAGGYGVYGPIYVELFVSVGLVAVVLAALLKTGWRWIPLASTIIILTFASTLTWIDLHFSNNYMAYIVAIFTLSIVYSTTPVGYAILLGASFTGLTALTWTTLPQRSDAADFLTNLIVVGVAYAACVVLERQRRQADEMAVRLEELNEQLKETSFRDELTGLYNRRFLVEFLATKRALAMRQSIPLSVVLIDVDHFKKINDTLGHAVGDMVLQRLSQALSDGVREADVAARYGGEEFILVLPHTPAATATQAAERILRVVSDLSFPGVPWKITFSAGVSELEAGEPMETLLERADRRLYVAKRTRNRVVSSG